MKFEEIKSFLTSIFPGSEFEEMGEILSHSEFHDREVATRYSLKNMNTTAISELYVNKFSNDDIELFIMKCNYNLPVMINAYPGYEKEIISKFINNNSKNTNQNNYQAESLSYAELLQLIFEKLPEFHLERIKDVQTLDFNNETFQAYNLVCFEDKGYLHRSYTFNKLAVLEKNNRFFFVIFQELGITASIMNSVPKVDIICDTVLIKKNELDKYFDIMKANLKPEDKTTELNSTTPADKDMIETVKDVEDEKEETKKNTSASQKSTSSQRPELTKDIGACNMNVKLRVGGRKAPRGGEEHIEEYANDYDIIGVFDLPKVAKDLGKVDFDTENYGMEKTGTTKTGIDYILGWAGGDWEQPVYFFIYWDGKYIRGYVPTKGNAFNTLTGAAFGNDEEQDAKYFLKEFGVVTGWSEDDDIVKKLDPKKQYPFEKWDNTVESPECDIDAMLEDFESRLEVI